LGALSVADLNDYDFGEGRVPTVASANLQHFIDAVADTASETFPPALNEPFNFLNLDVYVYASWRLLAGRGLGLD
jgi:hypothetical protein